MKAFIAILMLLATNLSYADFSQDSMKDYAANDYGTLLLDSEEPGYVKQEKNGYSLEVLADDTQMGGNFVTQLADLEAQAQVTIQSYEDSEDINLSDITVGIVVDTIVKVYKDGTFVGYIVEAADLVDAAIIQDGSGILFYLDTDMNVVAVNTWQG